MTFLARTTLQSALLLGIIVILLTAFLLLFMRKRQTLGSLLTMGGLGLSAGLVMAIPAGFSFQSVGFALALAEAPVLLYLGRASMPTSAPSASPSAPRTKAEEWVPFSIGLAALLCWGWHSAPPFLAPALTTVATVLLTVGLWRSWPNRWGTKSRSR